MILPTKNNHLVLLTKPNRDVVLASCVILLAKHNHVASLAKPNCVILQIFKADGKRGRSEQFCSNTWASSHIHALQVSGLQDHHRQFADCGNVAQREADLAQVFLLEERSLCFQATLWSFSISTNQIKSF